MLWMGASATDTGVKVQWTTASERNNAGFIIYRYNSDSDTAEPLNNTPVPGLGDSPFGRTYSFIDVQGMAGDQYFIEDIAFSGKTKLNGPFNAEYTDNMMDRLIPRLISRHDRPFNFKRRMRRLFAGSARKAGHTRDSKNAKFKVDTFGLHYLSAAALADENIHVNPGLISVKRNKKAVPLISDKNGVWFVGVPKKDRYADYSVYTAGNGRPKKMKTAAVRGCRFPTGSLRQTEVFEQNNNYYVATPTSDPFFWKSAYIGYPASLQFDLDNLAADSGKIKISLVGYATGVEGPDHAANFYLNGRLLGIKSWEGKAMHTVSFKVTGGLLESGNTLTVELIDDGIIDMLSIDKVAVSFNKELVAGNDGLVFKAKRGTCVSIRSSLNNPIVFDVTNPGSPVLLKGVFYSKGNIIFKSRGIHQKRSKRYSKNRYLITSPDAAFTPVPDGTVQTMARNISPNYLIITHPLFKEASDRLAAYHSSRGLTAKVVTTEQVYDRFSNGRPDPRAIRRLIQRTLRKTSGSLKFVLLMGGSTVDSNDVMGQGDDDFLPAPFYTTKLKGYEAPNDGWYTQGTDIAIGRLPVESTDEALAVVEKLINWSSQNSTADKSLFIADHDQTGDTDDPAGLFEQSAEHQIEACTGFEDSAVRMFLNAGPGRSDLNDIINQGVDFISYHGHAYLSGWSSGPQLANLAFADSLQNKTPFILLSWSCFDGSFVGPWDDSLAWHFVANPHGGAAAALAGSSLSSPYAVERFSVLLSDELSNGCAPTLGEALVKAEQRLLNSIGASAAQDTVNTYNLLGDPAALNPWN
jgi:hypothetical protein